MRSKVTKRGHPRDLPCALGALTTSVSNEMGRTMNTRTSHAVNLGRLNPKTVRLFYLLSPVVFGGASLVIYRVRGIGLAEAFRTPVSTPRQILFGSLIGVVSGLIIGIAVSRSTGLATLRQIIRQGFASARPTRLDLLLTSVSAGFSEELLFRGSLQPLLGIWITSVLFALAHGGAIRASKGNLAFGGFIFAVSLLLGTVYADVGLLASMATHFALDLVVLLQYRHLVAAAHDDQAVQS